ncbi:MAG: hypothetical protein P8Z37_04995 [Acidobacteriota bacterium]
MNKNCLLAKKVLLFFSIMLLFAAGSTMAQTRFGLRAGGTINPEQFHFGAHVISAPLIENFTFRPNLEVGVSKFVVVAANFEFAYAIQVKNKPFSIYAGLGPSLIVAADSNNADAGGGLNVLFGMEHRNGFMGEMKVGAIDSPDLKFTVGYTF